MLVAHTLEVRQQPGLENCGRRGSWWQIIGGAHAIAAKAAFIVVSVALRTALVWLFASGHMPEITDQLPQRLIA